MALDESVDFIEQLGDSLHLVHEEGLRAAEDLGFGLAPEQGGLLRVAEECLVVQKVHLPGPGWEDRAGESALAGLSWPEEQT